MSAVGIMIINTYKRLLIITVKIIILFLREIRLDFNIELFKFQLSRPDCRTVKIFAFKDHMASGSVAICLLYCGLYRPYQYWFCKAAASGNTWCG